MKQIVIYLLTVQRLLNLKQQILKFQHIHYAQETCQDWSQDNMKKTGFSGYIYDFSADYNAIAVSDILDIHKYLTKKNRIV